MFSQFEETLTFDDVLLVPRYSCVLPNQTELNTMFTRQVRINIPFCSAPMDTVTEHKMAIALALSGGVGIIHKNMAPDKQVKEVKKVKRFKNGFIENPITVSPDDRIDKVIQIREEQGYKKNPVVDNSGRLVGFISDVDYIIPEDSDCRVGDLMISRDKMVVAKEGISLEEANMMIRQHRLRTLCVVNDNDRLVAMVTRRDIEKNTQYPDAAKNKSKQLLVGAAIGVGEKELARADALCSAGVDIIVIDTAHGHSEGVLNMARRVKSHYPNQSVVAGNIATAEAARKLVEAGVDAVKVGIGPGSICTTRVVAGIGVPQLSAIKEVARGLNGYADDVPIIADGGIRTSGDIVKALAAGANVVMMGNMFAGTDESPGRVEFIEGRMYKIYRGMGSIDAMDMGSKDRYGQSDIKQRKKFVPEGVSGKVPYKGPVERILYQLSGGVRSGLGYCGAKNIKELHQKARFVRISNSGLKESHPHDLRSFDNAPNYEAE